MKDDAVKEEIERAVIETAKNEYGVDVEVDLSTISFAPANSKLIFPLTTDERLQVKTEVVGSEPSYHFKAYVSRSEERRVGKERRSRLRPEGKRDKDVKSTQE